MMREIQAIMAALMHDAMEDCGVTKIELIERFGAPTAEIVDGLTKLDKLEFDTREQNQAESFRKMLLAMSRAIGETMIVTMAAGLAANLTLNPLDTVTTVTVQIVTLLTGDQEFNSAKTLSAFGLGLTLFLVTLMLNVVAQRIVQKYRQQYD